MFLSSSMDRTTSSRNTSTVRAVKASVSPKVSGLRKPTFEGLNACSPPSSAKTDTTPPASKATERRRGSLLKSMGRLYEQGPGTRDQGLAGGRRFISRAPPPQICTGCGKRLDFESFAQDNF